MRMRGAAAVAVALIMVGVACGGSSYKGLSKADFVAQADAICKNYDTQGTAIGNALGSNPTEQQVIDAIKTKLIPLFKRQESDLRALKPPKEDRATVATLLDEFHAAIVKADTQTKTFVEERGNDPEFAKADAAAKAYGLQQCGQSSG